MTQSDSERLTTGFLSQIRESPFRIAPERSIELVDEMGGETWPLDFFDGAANFEALPNAKAIEGTYAALLSLWAVAASVWAIFSTARMARDAGYEQIDLMTLPAGRMAIDLKRAALEIIRDPDALWGEAPHRTSRGARTDKPAAQHSARWPPRRCGWHAECRISYAARHSASTSWFAGTALAAPVMVSVRSYGAIHDTRFCRKLRACRDTRPPP